MASLDKSKARDIINRGPRDPLRFGRFLRAAAQARGSENERCAMAMWLYDDVREMEDFQTFQREVRGLEREYLEIRVLLRDAEEALRADPDSDYLRAKVRYLGKRQRDLESRGPRLAADHPLEIALWAPPHG